AQHEKEVRKQGGTTWLQFFFIVFAISFTYYIVPNYLFPFVSTFSIACVIWGLGFSAFCADCATISSYLSTLIATPGHAILNVMAVFVDAGQRYDTAIVINPKTFQFNPEGYAKVGPIFVMSYGLNLATFAAVFTHIILFHGRYWSGVLLITIALAFAACLGFGGQLQLLCSGILLACAVSFAFTLLIGILTAITNVQPRLNTITEMIIGCTYPGRPVANVSFKTYGYVNMVQAIYFLSDFKLGHYMKISPKSMFVVQILVIRTGIGNLNLWYSQLVGTVVATSVYFGTSWRPLSTIPNICNSEKNPLWDCPNDNIFYSASII
ncbi:hypothetical protein EJ110_NYTH01626, partial [Nymphaea thermarum]